jgi:thymidylate synthase
LDTEDLTQRKLGEANEILDRYEDSIGLRVQQVDAERYLNLEQSVLSKLEPVELGEACYVLARYSLWLQKQCNRFITDMNWADSNIKVLAARAASNYTGYSYEERKHCAIMGDEYMKKLYSVKVESQKRADRLAYLSQRVDFMAKTLNNLKETKENRRGKAI